VSGLKVPDSDEAAALAHDGNAPARSKFLLGSASAVMHNGLPVLPFQADIVTGVTADRSQQQ